MKDELIEKVAERLWNLKHPNQGYYKMLDEVNKEFYRVKARELIALIQPDADVLAKIRDIANGIQDGMNQSDYTALEIMKDTDKIISLCTPETEPEKSLRDEIRDALVACLDAHVGYAIDDYDLTMTIEEIMEAIEESGKDG